MINNDSNAGLTEKNGYLPVKEALMIKQMNELDPDNTDAD